MSDVPSGACLDLFTPEPPGDARVLVVSYTKPADRWLAEWREHVGVPPADVAVVSVGGASRSATAQQGGAGTGAGAAQPVEVVESPEDLTGLGIALGQQLSTWAGASDDPIVVCFDSTTALLQYADLQRTFRFLHVLAGRVAGQGAQVHYHLDPTAVDDRAVAALTSLFDASVRYDDGDRAVRTR